MLESLFLGSSVDPREKLIRSALDDYFVYQNADDAEKLMAAKLFGTRDQENEDRALDIELKKRQIAALGPQDTQKFNAEPAARILSSLGITWGKQLSPPKESPAPSNWITRIFDDAEPAISEGTNAASSVDELRRAVGISRFF